MKLCFFLVCCSFPLAFATSAKTDVVQSVIPAERLCKPGPPLKRTPGKINCLVIGDSISIGYTPWVAEALGDSHQVQHAPWDSYGGALDSKYGFKCLQMFLLTVMLEPTSYDVIIFNFGIHDINYMDVWPEEYTAPTDYAKNVREIKSLLLSTGAKVGYVLSTPIPDNVEMNNRVKLYNSIASNVMKEQPTVTTADLYDWIVEACGEPPCPDCIIVDKYWRPHYTQQGWEYLSGRVNDLILELSQNLVQTDQENPKCSKLLQAASRDPLPCRDKSGRVVTMCPSNSTCCESAFSSSGQGCCLTPQAVPCGDGKHYCPAGYRCDPGCTRKRCSCQKM